MMQKPEGFLEKLLGFKDIVDANLVPQQNVQFVKNNYLNLPHFNPEA
jgi:dynein heavy chain